MPACVHCVPNQSATLKRTSGPCFMHLNASSNKGDCRDVCGIGDVWVGISLRGFNSWVDPQGVGSAWRELDPLHYARLLATNEARFMGAISGGEMSLEGADFI